MDEFQRVKGWSLERNVKRLHGWLYDPCSPLSREMDLEKIAKASQQNNSAELRMERYHVLIAYRELRHCSAPNPSTTDENSISLM